VRIQDGGSFEGGSWLEENVFHMVGSGGLYVLLN